MSDSGMSDHPQEGDRRLADEQLEQLRSLRGVEAPEVSAVLATASWARSVPAWNEPFQMLVDRCLQRTDLSTADADALVDAQHRLAAAALACPQVVGLDPDVLALRQAEWVDGNLSLDLVPGPLGREVLAADGRRTVMFRVVGAEPRMWETHGLTSLRLEQTMRALLVRTPVVEGSVQLIRSSY